MRLARAAALLALVTAAACAHAPPPQQPVERPPPRRSTEPAPPRTEEPESPPETAAPPEPAVEVGMASYYAHRFHGRRTASGEKYDMHKLTCAHPTAPFGTKLRVTVLDTGRSVVVTVNDRGPYAKGRVVDLSLAAAKQLGITKHGVVKVRVERVGEGDRDQGDRS